MSCKEQRGLQQLYSQTLAPTAEKEIKTTATPKKEQKSTKETTSEKEHGPSALKKRVHTNYY